MFEPVLEPSYLPSPRVKVTFETLAPATETVTVWRVADVTAKVPGTVGAFAAGGYTIDDKAAPHSIPVTYFAEMFDGSGASLGRTGSSTTTVWGERNVAWVSDPYDAENAVAVEMAASFAESLSGSRSVERHNVGGKIVALAGPDGLYEGVDLSLKADTQEQVDKLASILAGTFVLFRVAPYVRPSFPTLFYAAVEHEIVDAPHMGGFQYGGTSTDFKVKGDQLSPFTEAGSIGVPWQRYIDAFPTWQDMIDAYPTWLDAIRNPPGV